MKSYLLAYVAVLVTYLILDGIWLGLIAKASYVDAMAGLMRNDYPVWPWIAFYTLYSAAIIYLVIHPNQSSGWKAIVIAAAILGMASYGAYNLTNYALIKDWPLSITFKDWAWGIFVTTASSLSGYYAIRYL